MIFTPLKPMLLQTPLNVDLNKKDFIYEPKFDGFRILLHKNGKRVELFTRHGNRITNKLPEIVDAAKSMNFEKGILDGEGVVFRDGRTVFDGFSYRGRLSDPLKIKAASLSTPATFVAFDVICIGDISISKPLIERKKLLEELVLPSDRIITTPYAEGSGEQLYEWTRVNDWEGIVYKCRDSKYLLDTRSNEWLKAKHWKKLDVVILGYRLNSFALIVGAHFKTVKNKPIAVVEYGLSPEEKQSFLRVAEQIHMVKDKNGTQWIEPRLCCRVQYLERTENHNLRTVTFKGFIFEKKPESCLWVS